MLYLKSSFFSNSKKLLLLFFFDKYKNFFYQTENRVFQVSTKICEKLGFWKKYNKFLYWVENQFFLSKEKAKKFFLWVEIFFFLMGISLVRWKISSSEQAKKNFFGLQNYLFWLGIRNIFPRWKKFFCWKRVWLGDPGRSSFDYFVHGCYVKCQYML